MLCTIGLGHCTVHGQADIHTDERTLSKEVLPMGKGDQRSKRGKTWIGTYGKTRPKKAKKVAAAKKAVAKPTRKAAK